MSEAILPTPHTLLWRAQHSFALFRNFIYVLIQWIEGVDNAVEVFF
jgi:hypothetical protein